MKIELDEFERLEIIRLIEKEYKGNIVEYEEMVAVKELLKKIKCSNEKINKILN